MLKRLTETEIQTGLATAPAWTRVEGEDAITRSLRFKDFPTAFGFMTAVALEAQRIDHHPDWSNSWSTVEITLRDHTTGGMTRLDFDLAARIDRHAEAAGGEPAAT